VASGVSWYAPTLLLTGLLMRARQGYWYVCPSEQAGGQIPGVFFGRSECATHKSLIVNASSNLLSSFMNPPSCNLEALRANLRVSVEYEDATTQRLLQLRQ
jgi:hypothetical protein